MESMQTLGVQGDTRSYSLPRSGAISSFETLKAVAVDRGLFNRQPRYYLCMLLLTYGVYVQALMILPYLNGRGVVFADALLLGIAFSHVAFLVHDLAHRQVFGSRRLNRTFALIHTGLLLGVSLQWWETKHQLHHANPNQRGKDPDVAVSVLAFSVHDALASRGVLRSVMKYQAYLFFPLLALEAIHIRWQSIAFVAGRRFDNRRCESLLMTIHYLVVFGYIGCTLGSRAVFFLLVLHAVIGLYLGAAFSTNHIGMPIIDESSGIDFVRHQIITTRDLKCPRFLDPLLGGLSHQIEHHLFPGMPQNKLREARELVHAYCRQHSIVRHETSLIRSFAEILRYLHSCSAPLRER